MKKREREDFDEIGNMTRFCKCFNPSNPKTDGEKEKDREREKKRDQYSESCCCW